MEARRRTQAAALACDRLVSFCFSSNKALQEETIRLHDLRHSVASNLLNAGFSVVQVQEWLGHSSASTTLNFYAHIDKTSKLNIAAQLDQMVSIA